MKGCWRAPASELLVNACCRRKGVWGKHPQLGPGIPWIFNVMGQPDVRSTSQLLKLFSAEASRSAPWNRYRNTSWITRSGRTLRLRTVDTRAQSPFSLLFCLSLYICCILFPHCSWLSLFYHSGKWLLPTFISPLWGRISKLNWYLTLNFRFLG